MKKIICVLVMSAFAFTMTAGDVACGKSEGKCPAAQKSGCEKAKECKKAESGCCKKAEKKADKKAKK